MKVFSSTVCFAAISSIFFAVNPALGYEYGEGCCKYNDKRMGNCEFHSSQNGLRIEWSDGLTETYKLISQKDLTSKTYADKRGGVWEYTLYAQGNVSLENKKNGNTIWKPLRGCVDK